MIRTQIQLTEWQSFHLKKLAAQLNTPIAELIRRAVDNLLGNQIQANQHELRQRALEITDMFRSDVEDLGVNHDRYVVEAYNYFHTTPIHEISA